MKALILDGSPAGDWTSSLLLSALQSELERRGASTTTRTLREMDLYPCLGDFKCWLETPGLCHIKDDGRELARAVHDAELLVLFGPSGFGGYCSTLKRGLDRLICLLTPLFETRAGEVHHQPRYARPPRLLGLAWSRAPSEERQRAFARLVESNAVNFSAPRFAAGLLSADPSRWAAPLTLLLEEALAEGARPPRLERGEETARELLSVARASVAPGPAAPAISRVALLVGSARPKGTSTSEALGRGLLRPLQSRGAELRVVHATEFEHAQRSEPAVRALLSAELLVLSTPLYCDSLPFLVTKALEEMAAARIEGPKPRLVTIVNCGFPEAAQCTGALVIARAFAEEAGLGWAGGIALGGGEAIKGQPLEELHGPLGKVHEAIARAGAALAAQALVPDEAIAAMARPLMPSWLYRAAGNLGNRWEAHRRGAKHGALLARPFDEPRGEAGGPH